MRTWPGLAEPSDGVLLVTENELVVTVTANVCECEAVTPDDVPVEVRVTV